MNYEDTDLYFLQRDAQRAFGDAPLTAAEDTM